MEDIFIEHKLLYKSQSTFFVDEEDVLSKALYKLKDSIEAQTSRCMNENIATAGKEQLKKFMPNVSEQIKKNATQVGKIGEYDKNLLSTSGVNFLHNRRHFKSTRL